VPSPAAAVGRATSGADAGDLAPPPAGADAHAAVRSLNQLVCQKFPRVIGMPDIVLHIQRALGRSGQHHSRRERIHATLEGINPGQARMFGYDGRKGATQGSGAGLLRRCRR